MIIQCDNCQSKFRLDDSKLGPKGVKVKCTKCENVFIVKPEAGAEESAAAAAPPSEQAAPSPPASEAAAPTEPAPPAPPASEAAAPTEPAPPAPPASEAAAPAPTEPTPPSEDSTMETGAGEFDFEQEQSAGDTGGESAPPGEDAMGVPGPSDFEFDFSEGDPSGQKPSGQEPSGQGAGKDKDEAPGDLDLGYGQGDAAGETPAEAPTEAPAGAPAETLGEFELDKGQEEGAEETGAGSTPEGTPVEGGAEGAEGAPGGEGSSGDFALGFEEEKPDEEPGAGEEQPSGDFNLGFEEEKPVGEDIGDEGGGAEEDVVKFSIGEEGEEGGEEGEGPPSFEDESPAGDLADDLAEQEGFGGEEDKSIQSLITKVEAHQKAVKGRILYFVLFLLVIVGAALGYYSGYFDPYLKRPVAAPAVENALEILNLEGSFADNENIGRVFVLSASVKNTTDVPQLIEAVKGVIYNKAGERIKTILVSPGWRVSPEELRTLTGEELKKRFEDLSAVSVRPNTTMPVMVVFTELPAGMTEAEIEIVR